MPRRLCAALAAACFSLALANGSIMIEKAEREVSLDFPELLASDSEDHHRGDQTQFCNWLAQINAAKYIVLERQTVTYKNTGSQPVTEILLCHPADEAVNRAFFEVCPYCGPCTNTHQSQD